MTENAQKQELRAYQTVLDQVKLLPQPRVYRNSTPVANVSGENLTVWDAMTAAILGNLNTLLVGERGEGKTQLENELKNALFGGNATYLRMRDNLRIKDIFEVYNLDKLFHGKGTVLDAKEQTPAVKRPLTIIDEINRAHEKVQNQVLDIYDGYIVFEGPRGPEKIQLGVEIEKGLYFHAAVASANIAARYTGTSPIDPALLDRSHLVLNVDNFTPTTVDHAVLLAEVSTPKVIDYVNSDHTQQIIGIHRHVKDMRLSLDGLIALLYLRKGIDHCIHPENETHSKTPVLAAMPAMCEGCNELAKGCGYTYPVSIRTEKAIAMLAKGLKVVGDSKSDEVRSLRPGYQEILTAFTLVAPYSGMLDQRWIDQEYLSNEQFAISALVQGIGKAITDRKKDLHAASAEAFAGELSAGTKGRFTERWEWYGDLLVALNTAAKKIGNLSKISAEERAAAVKDFPVLRWLE